ncbi:MAG: hypothetical protein RMH74_07970 [Candidatus Caldarchaeum sp.]|nr:hypothetical protein [Candidatus Caldarchaeum sp.]
MRAQLAVSSMIVFGLVLIGFGFVGLPYVYNSEGTVVVQTSSGKTVQTEEVVETVSYDTYSLTSVLTTRLTTVAVETVQTTSRATKTLTHVEGLYINTGTALILGPFELKPHTVVEVSWMSDPVILVYTASKDELGNSSGWVLLGSGLNGLAKFNSSEGRLVYLVLSPSSDRTLLKALMIASDETVPVATEIRRTATVETSTTITTLTQTPRTTTYTTLSITTVIEYFTVAVRTTLTETRYADLSFMAVMGSFLVFAGILVMMLLLRTVAKPAEKNV